MFNNYVFDNIVSTLLAILILFLLNFLLRYILNIKLYRLKLKNLVYDCLSVSILLVLMQWLFVLSWLFLFDLIDNNTIFRVLFFIFLLVWLPTIYIIFKKRYYLKHKINLTMYYPLIETILLLTTIPITLYLVYFL